MQTSLNEAAKMLLAADDIHILSHQYPDGDTLGSACALCHALRQLGKRAVIRCSDSIHPKYQFLFVGLADEQFEPKFVVSVDIADTQLFGDGIASYIGRVDLCLDHHGSNAYYANYTYVDSSAAATTEVIYDLLPLLGLTADRTIANCIYTGITTDTGCFRYTNATPRTYRIAADMMETGINAADINRLMFDTKSRARLEIERHVIDSMRFFFDDKCAVISVTKDMIEQSGANEGDIEGLASLPRQVEGVLVGITMREKCDGTFKLSLRTEKAINASAICARFGGGGHPTAAGCTIKGGLESAEKQILDAVGDYLRAQDEIPG